MAAGLVRSSGCSSALQHTCLVNKSDNCQCVYISLSGRASTVFTFKFIMPIHRVRMT
jgi:hypothetical protein